MLYLCRDFSNPTLYFLEADPNLKIDLNQYVITKKGRIYKVIDYVNDNEHPRKEKEDLIISNIK